jgi:hypothetical protein
LPELVRATTRGSAGSRYFPGHPWPDIYRVRVQQEFDEFAPFNEQQLQRTVRQADGA